MPTGIYPRRAWTIDRLLATVEPDLNSGCWLWPRGNNGRGYGCLRIDGTQHSAHRHSWRLHNGQIPPDMFVLHRCDTPACVNPAHLFLGTHDANMADMKAKGRADDRRGEKSYAAKLAAEQVVQIRRLRGVVSQRKLAAHFGISKASIWSIQSKQTWRHLA